MKNPVKRQSHFQRTHISGNKLALWLRRAIGLFVAATAITLVPAHLHAKSPTKRVIPQTHKVTVRTNPIENFHTSGIGSHTYGKLRFLGGLNLTSSWKGFGGWSDLVMARDGQSFLAISDDGHWLRGKLKYRGLKPVGLSNLHRGELQALSGRILKGKRERDAEGIALLNGTLDNGSLVISFERLHRIGRFKTRAQAIVGPSKYLKLPKKARRLWRNKGLESVTVLRAGRLKGAIITVAERSRGATNGNAKRPGWIFRKGRAHAFEIKDHGNMDITSLAGLPNGDLLVLERRFRWSEGVKMRIRRIRAKDIRPGALADGEVLLEAGLGYEVDNMEGLSVHQGPGGETILTLISDDNFNKLLQRTILLQFQLDDAPLRARNQ